MAGYSMEPNAVWMPCDVQLANWTMEPAAYEPGIPTMEYASTDIFGSSYASTDIFGSSCQTSIPIWDGEQQCECEVATQYRPPKTTKQEPVVDFHRETKDDGDLLSVFKKVAEECGEDVKMKPIKMHRYPASIRDLGLNARYTTPTLVAIGPYYHGCRNLQEAEKMKHVAAYLCIKDSVHSVQSMYDAVVPVAVRVHSRYDKHVQAAGIGYDDFLHMMFFDACFLVQWMLVMSDRNASVEMEESLSTFFDTNYDEIFHDIMLLENQIPWPVVETVMKFRHVPMDKFIWYLKNCLQETSEEKSLLSYESYEAPHLLGLLRFHIVGKSRTSPKRLTEVQQKSLSHSASELAEIGINLKANKNKELIHMGVEMKCIFGELFLAPVSLDYARASCLLSMAALELCTTSNFEDAEDQDSAVCSYVLLLAMLVARDDDVQKLRTRHVLQGVGLANWELVDFFTRLRDLHLGSRYVRTVMQIERYKSRCWLWTKFYALYYRNKTTFVSIGSFFVGIATIVGTIFTVIQTVSKSPDKPCCHTL